MSKLWTFVSPVLPISLALSVFSLLVAALTNGMGPHGPNNWCGLVCLYVHVAGWVGQAVGLVLSLIRTHKYFCQRRAVRNRVQ